MFRVGRKEKNDLTNIFFILRKQTKTSLFEKKKQK
jgi:hypothetical protein